MSSLWWIVAAVSGCAKICIAGCAPLETCSTRFGAGPPSFPSVAARSSSSILQSFIGAVVFRSVHRGASLDDARTYVRPRGAKKGFLYVRTYLVLCVVGVPAVAGG